MGAKADSPSSYLRAASERVVVFDGAPGTILQLADLTADDFGGPELEGCNEVLVDTRPDVIERLHRDFIEVGAEVIETDTFGCFSVVLAGYGMAPRSEELNHTAALLARRVADDYAGRTV